MAQDDRAAGAHDLSSPFLFVPHGDSDPTAWKSAHPGWISVPATMVPRTAAPLAQGHAGPDRVNWLTDRQHHPEPSLRDHGRGEPAPGERPAAFPEPEADVFRAMMAVMDDPVGTLSAAGIG